jgi:hypothetical protein
MVRCRMVVPSTINPAYCIGLNSNISELLTDVAPRDLSKASLFYQLASYRGSVLASWLLAKRYVQQNDNDNALKYIRRCYVLRKSEKCANNYSAGTSYEAAGITEVNLDLEEHPECFVTYNPVETVTHSVEHTLCGVSADAQDEACARTPGTAPSAVSVVRYHVGDEVLANSTAELDHGKYHLAKIISIHTDHSVVICYQDDHVEEEVSLDRLKPTTSASHYLHPAPLPKAAYQTRPEHCDQQFEYTVSEAPIPGATPSSLGDTAVSAFSTDSSFSPVSPHTIVSFSQSLCSATVIGAGVDKGNSIVTDEFGSRPLDFEIEVALAELLVDRGREDDLAFAYELYNDASASCAALGKSKLAAKYAELAESI